MLEGRDLCPGQEIVEMLRDQIPIVRMDHFKPKKGSFLVFGRGVAGYGKTADGVDSPAGAAVYDHHGIGVVCCRLKEFLITRG
jgi:hypothetical protein